MRRTLLFLVFAAAVPQWAAQPVRARHGMVVSRERHATQAGLKVLESGGNAVDAAVAVGFALAVTHPSAGNIGGGGFMLLRTADGRSTFLDFRERAPAKASRDMYLGPDGKATADSTIGYRASGVPGTVRGLEYASKKYGRKPWADLVRPAVELAAKGFPLSYGTAQSLRTGARTLGRFPETNRIFLRDGKFYEPGDLLVQPDLAKTLDRIMRLGARDFYEGETARLLAKDMADHGGLIALDDLKSYTTKERAPLTGRYRGFDIIAAPPPSSGGVGILQMLGVLEGTSFQEGGAGSATVVHYMTEAMRRYFADRSEHLGDSDFVKVPLTSLLDPKYIARLRSSILPERATPSAEVKAGVFTGHESNETTHYTVADAEGNIVCVTYTLNGGFGSKVTATGLGFLLNNEMDDFAPKPGEANMYGLIQGEANAIAPGKTPLSSMTPTIVLKDGKPYLALGSPGGPTIINSVLEVIVNVLDFGMNVQDAVNWPRFHHQWLPDELRVEPGYSPDTVALLEARGYTVKRAAAQGEVAAIRFNNGWLEGAADPRTEVRRKDIEPQMNHFLSTHLFVNHRLTSALLTRIQQAGIPAVEIFCARQHLDYRNKAQVAELGHWFRDSDLKLHSLHSPMYNDEIWGRSGPHAVITITEQQKNKRLPMVDEIKRALEVSEVIPFRYLIQHIGVSGEEFDLRKVDAAFAALEEISLFARQRGVEVLLENIPNDLSSAERLRQFEELTHLHLNYVFDTGHAHMNEGVEAAFEIMQDKIRSTHVHDNNGKEDKHLFPIVSEGGSIDWENTMRLLRSRESQYPLLLELKEKPDLSSPLEAVKEILDRLEDL